MGEGCGAGKHRHSPSIAGDSFMPIDTSIATQKAQSILAGSDTSPEQALDLVKELHAIRQFGLARKMLDALCKREEFCAALDADPPLKLRFAQKRSLSTYK